MIEQQIYMNANTAPVAGGCGAMAASMTGKTRLGALITGFVVFETTVGAPTSIRRPPLE